MTQTFERSPQPTRSPWGLVQEAEEIAPGIWQVHTAGHGGIKLSAQRNRLVPDYLRCDRGWYEEDCDWAIVAVVFPEPFRVLKPWQVEKGKSHYDYAVESMQRWHPEEYARFLNEHQVS